jgi:hypothetical protein
MVGSLVNDEVEKMFKDAVLVWLKYYPAIYLEGLRDYEIPQ